MEKTINFFLNDYQIKEIETVLNREKITIDEAIIAFLKTIVHQHKIPSEVMAEHTMKKIPTFANWDSELHGDVEQLRRITSAKMAKTTPQSIDKENQTAFFPSSGETPYFTTLENCTCIDFARRELPCKHIYRLAMELGIIEETAIKGINKNTIQTSQITEEEAIMEIEKFPQDIQIFIMKLMPLLNVDYPVGLYLDKNLQQILSCPLFIFKPAPPSDIIKDMRKKDNIYFLDQLCVQPGEKLKKDDLITWCLKHIPTLSDKLPEKVYVYCNPLFSKNIKKIKHHFEDKFGELFDCISTSEPIYKYQKYPSNI